MAKSDRIELIIEGLPEDNGNVRLGAFISQLQSLNAVLAKIDREANDGRQSVSFQITALSHNSPARVVLESKSVGRSKVPEGAIIERLEFISSALQSGADLAGFDPDLLEDIRGLSKPVGRLVKNTTVLFDGSKLELTSTINAALDRALAVEEECDGAIEGMLEQINVHHGANVFHIFPEIGPRKVTCHFPSALYDDAVFAIGRRVEVNGILKYRAGATYPHQIAVKSLEAYPLEEDLPDWEDIRGRAPDATGLLSSEAFVRELRDAWQ